MPRIVLTTRIAAPRERVFDLARSLDLHMRSTAESGERAIGGRTSGLIDLGETVTWRARHLGSWHTMTSAITEFDRPAHFHDSMVAGPFRELEHDHDFEEAGSGGTETLMRDTFEFTAPLGPLGWILSQVYLTGYMTRLLLRRNAVIQKAAESGEWAEYLPVTGSGRSS